MATAYNHPSRAPPSAELALVRAGAGDRKVILEDDRRDDQLAVERRLHEDRVARGRACTACRRRGRRRPHGLVAVAEVAPRLMETVTFDELMPIVPEASTRLRLDLLAGAPPPPRALSGSVARRAAGPPNEMMPRTNMPKIGASRGTDEEKCVGVYRRRRPGHALPREKGVARPSREMWRHVLPATQGVGEPRKVRRPCEHPRRTAGTQALRVAPDLPAVPFPGTETSCQDSIVVLRQEARCSPHCSAQPSLRRHDDKAST